MQSIEERAIDIFQNNLAYFKNEHPEVYLKIDILNQAITEGIYNEKYSLEYKNGYFDVLELATNNYLYNQDSNEYANEVTNNVNFKKSDNVIEGFFNQNITQSVIDSYEEEASAKLDVLYATAKIINYSNSVTSKNDYMKYIEKYIFLGVGLGTHLAKIQKKTSASMLLIFEDNIELFRLSLFTTDYTQLSKSSSLYFSIMQDNLESRQTIEKFYTKGFNNNQYIKYTLFSKNYIDKIKLIQSYIVSSSNIVYPYSSILKAYLKCPEYLVENVPFIDTSKIHINSPLNNKPLLLIASGPSLDKYSKWLQENQNKFIIVAVLSASKTLFNLGVKPDIVVHIDSQEISVNLFDGVDTESFFKNTIFIFSSIVSRNVFNSFNKDNIYCFETTSRYKQGYKTITGASVGETTYALSLILGATSIYLLGLDLALDPDTKQSHTQEHMSSNRIFKEQDETSHSLHGTLVKVKGNFIETTFTTPLYQMSIYSFNHFSNIYLNNTQKVYNLNNGAYLDGSIPLKIEKLEINKLVSINNGNKFDTLKSFLSNISSKINNNDIKFLDSQIKEGINLLNIVEKFKKNTLTNNYEVYIKEFYLLFSELAGMKNNRKFDINNVFYNYLYYISGYIFDIFNTKGLKNQKRHLKKIHNIITDEVKKILVLYIKVLKVYKNYK